MRTILTPKQELARLAFREFVEREIVPFADTFDREERLPPEIITKLAASGYLRAALPEKSGGMDAVTLGLLNEEVGRGCSSVRSLLTVHHMVVIAVSRWGSERQKKDWLPPLAGGETIAAFGLSEQNVGSDARQVETAATRVGDSFILNGEKKWISFGQVASLFLIFARCEGRPCAFLVPHDADGFSTRSMTGLLGVRASMLAELRLTECRVPQESLIGGVGFGFSHIAATALDYGRYSVAWGCVGIAQACLDACLSHARERKQFGSLLKDHQLVRRMLSDMMTEVRAARLLCLHAGHLKELGDPAAIPETFIAKYFASRTAMRAASNAVQIHGARGCSAESSVARYFRDAKVMEIIEGSNEIQQLTIAEYGYFGG
jgi:glutaryl-CoA dehydrogenase (non-decarboxylating)